LVPVQILAKTFAAELARCPGTAISRAERLCVFPPHPRIFLTYCLTVPRPPQKSPSRVYPARPFLPRTAQVLPTFISVMIFPGGGCARRLSVIVCTRGVYRTSPPTTLYRTCPTPSHSYRQPHRSQTVGLDSSNSSILCSFSFPSIAPRQMNVASAYPGHMEVTITDHCVLP